MVSFWLLKVRQKPVTLINALLLRVFSCLLAIILGSSFPLFKRTLSVVTLQHSTITVP